MNLARNWRSPTRSTPPPIELDLVPIRRPPALLGWMLLAGGMLCAGIEARHFIVAREELAERSRILHELRARQPVAAPRVAAAPPLSIQEVQGAQRVIARLEADWSGVFAALARVRGADVAWVEIDMLEAQGRASRPAEAAGATRLGTDTALQGLRLAGEARSLDVVLAVLDRMRREPALAGVELVSHEPAAQAGASFVRFVIARGRGNG